MLMLFIMVMIFSIMTLIMLKVEPKLGVSMLVGLTIILWLVLKIPPA